VVIAIIATLAALLLPSLSAAREKALKIQCGHDMKQLAYLVHTYAQDHDGWYPHAFFQDDPSEWISERFMRLGYLPAQSNVDERNHPWTLICPVTRNNPIERYTIGYNGIFIFGKWLRTAKAGSIRNPAQGWMWMDSETVAPESRYIFWTYFDQALQGNYGFPTFRHNGSINVAYCDGHVGSVTETEYNDHWAMGAPGERAFWYGE
jgi:prepilin-type processing-associated H-X9-DG protein